MLARFAGKRLWLMILGALAALSGSGCLVFEDQKLVFTFSPDGHEVRALLVYQGLRVGGGTDDNLQSAKQDLAKLMTGQQDFYIGGALFHFSLAPPKPDVKEEPWQKQGRALLQKHFTITPGSFYVTKDGRLCAWQTITIRDGQRFTAGFNELISAWFDLFTTEALADKQPRELDEETLRAIQKAARVKYAWLTLEPGRLSFSFSGNAAVFADLKHRTLRSILVKDWEELADPPKGRKPLSTEDIRKQARDRERWAAALAATPLSIDQRRDKLTLSLGVGQGEPLRLTFPDEEEPKKELRKLDLDLIAHAHTLKVEFKDVTTEGLIEEFLKKHASK